MEQKTKITLLAVQMASVIGNLQENIKRVEMLLEKSLFGRNVDFVFLPEVWTCGWDCQSFPLVAETIETSDSIKMLKEIALKHRVNIVGGSILLRKDDGNLYNCCPVIDRSANLVCTYEKNHLFSYYGCAEGDYISVGKSPVLVELEGIKIGLTICYDIRFPEIYRAYRKAGADILVNMAAWGADKKIPWDCMTASRAVENQTYFVALTQTGNLRNGANLGHSMIYDFKGQILDEINKSEGVICTTIDLEEMYSFRDKCRVLEDIKDSYEVVIK